MLDYCLRKESRMLGVVVTEPSLKLAIDPLTSKVVLGNLMNSTWLPYTQASGLETAALSRDPQLVQMYIDDPLVHDRVSVRMFVGFYEAGLIYDLKVWPDFYHELHHEPEKDIVIEYAVNWLNQHLGKGITNGYIQHPLMNI